MKPLPIFLAVMLTYASTAAAQSENKSVIAKHEIESFDLDRARAPEVVKILNEQFLGAVTFSANSATNVIYGRVPKDVLPEVKRFIAELEDVATMRLQEQLEKEREQQIDREKREIEHARAQEAADAKRRFKSISLQYVKAIDAFNAAKDLGFDGKLAITMEPNTNSLLVRGDDESLAAFEKLIQILDVDPRATKGRDKAEVDLRMLEIELAAVKKTHAAPDNPIVLDLQKKIKTQESLLKLWEERLARPVDPPRQTSRSSSAYEAAERKAATLAQQWREEDEKAEPSATKLSELEAAVKEQVRLAFETRQQLKKVDLERATEQLETIRKRLETREKIADEIVQRRVQDLIRGDDLTWLARETSDSRPDGKVVVEALNNEIIMLRGAKEDVEKIKQTIRIAETRHTKRPSFAGSVVRVNGDDETVLLSIGTDDGIRLGNTLSVSRDGVEIGQLKVVSVAADESTARIEAAKDDTAIETGDDVKVLTEGGNPGSTGPGPGVISR